MSRRYRFVLSGNRLQRFVTIVVATGLCLTIIGIPLAILGVLREIELLEIA